MDIAELQKQVSNLMKAVQDKRKLQAAAKAQLATATANTTSASPPEMVAKGPKIATPDKFDGTRGVKAEVYASQVGLYVISNAPSFPENRSKIVFALSYLTGMASAWAQCFTTCIFAGEEVTYDEFLTAFQAMSFNTKKRACAEKALRALKQTKTVAAYTHAFMIHAHNCGWEAWTLVSQYTQGLHKDIRLALVLAQTLFETLAEVSQLALKIDNKIHGADKGQPSAPTPSNP